MLSVRFVKKAESGDLQVHPAAREHDALQKRRHLISHHLRQSIAVPRALPVRREFEVPDILRIAVRFVHPTLQHDPLTLDQSNVDPKCSLEFGVGHSKQVSPPARKE